MFWERPAPVLKTKHKYKLTGNSAIVPDQHTSFVSGQSALPMLVFLSL